MGEGWDKIIVSVKGHPLISRMPEIRDTGNTVIVTLFGPSEELLEKGPAKAWDDLGRL